MYFNYLRFKIIHKAILNGFNLLSYINFLNAIKKQILNSNINSILSNAILDSLKL